jgi:eukaryotic-like serine/threonine-protein kinase
MGMSDEPQDSQNTPVEESSGRTLSAGAASGGAAAGQIGPYRMLQMLGEGGMGEVWLAEQKTPIHRTVALKLIKAGMDTKAVVARFESERQALALMDHPNIAQVYDAGSTPEGRPYFVMEYVPGLPITEYCDKHRLTMKERLELFMQVCEGVQHAHQKAIIHRDLKPSNVLVVEQDNKAVPKIIDFGLAKATAQRLTDKTLFTELGVLVGTPEYMSPEQADHREQNIDTRTDVYSLGVILYELLVGVLPFETKALRAAGLDAVLRVIREQEPPKPSTKVRSMGEGSTAAAEKRREEPRTFARHLQGELDWITLKALEKERARRYGSAAEFSADISRYLRSEPVLAGPATKGYLIKKYAARHRVGMAAATTVVLLVIGFVVTQAVELHRIRLERDRANRERDRATRITDFMTSMFKVSDPNEARGNSVTAREILENASTEIETGLAKDPELQAQMMSVMGSVYSNLGLYPRAELLLQSAVGIQQRVLGPESPETLKSMAALAWTIYREGRLAEAETLERQGIEAERRVTGPESQDTLTSMHRLAYILDEEGQYPEAEKVERETLDIRLRVLGPDHPETLMSTDNLANILEDEGRYAEAEKLQQETLDIRRRVLGREHLQTLDSMTNLGSILHAEGNTAEAEELYREALDGYRRVLGPEHTGTLVSMNNLASVLRDEGHDTEAEKLDRETLDIRRRVLGPEHPHTLVSQNNLAEDLRDEGRYVEAEKLDRETLDIRRRVLGPERPATLNSMANLVVILSITGRNVEAEELGRQTMDIRRRVLGPEHPDTARSTYDLACIEAHLGRRDEALSLLREAVDHGLSPDIDGAIDKDSDLKSLHGDPRFDALVAHAKANVVAGSAAPKPN